MISQASRITEMLRLPLTVALSVSQVPCGENLAKEVETGYSFVRAFKQYILPYSEGSRET